MWNLFQYSISLSVYLYQNMNYTNPVGNIQAA